MPSSTTNGTAMPYRSPKYIILLAIILLPTALAAGQPLCIDGLFNDWRQIQPIALDKTGDAEATFDLTKVYATSRGTVLYLRFDVGCVLNIQNGPAEQGTLRVELDLPGDKRLVIDLRARRAFMADNKDQRIPWPRLNYIVAPSYAQDEFEMQLDLQRFGVGIGSEIGIQFSGSDTLDKTVRFKMTEPVPKPLRRSAARTAETDLRIVNLNTRWGGLLDEQRAEAMGRYLRAAKADVYCFQEEWRSEDVAGALERLMPSPKGKPWHVHKIEGCVIASRLTLRPVPLKKDAYAGAVVELPDGGAVLVISVHLRAKGYLGDKRDAERITQATQIAETIREFRAGKLTKELAQYRHAAVVITGDLNLVGSKTPLDLLTTDLTLDLRPCPAAHLIGEAVYTWRGGNKQTFSPARLDYVIYSAGKLQPQNSFVLDTTQLNTQELTELQLERRESTVSDHLLLIADFQIK